jgi:beta-glucosidase
MDMAMEPARYDRFIKTLKDLVMAGSVPLARIDDAVTRILRVKFAMGLMNERRSQLAIGSLAAEFGSAEHREVARRAARESLVLLKNDRGALPLGKSTPHIHVAGKAADDIGLQCGGWTVTWQGAAGAVTPGGTTLRRAIEQSVQPGTRVTYSSDLRDAAGAGVIVVALAETPYAEGAGDRADLALTAEDAALVDLMATVGAPLVVVLFSGRPLILGDVLDRASAVVAAWLPGTEGRGITDVLFGDRAPSGKLGFTWPRSMAQIPRGVSEGSAAAGEPLFPFGFGLTYG